MAEKSIFTKIIDGELPSYKIYEDDKTIAFLPLNPIAKGHVLVVPKKQVDQFYDLPTDDYRALWEVVQKISKHMKNMLGTKRVGLQVVGLDVPHAHVHVIAFDTLEEFRQVEDMSKPPNHTKLKKLADKLNMENA